MNMRTDIQRNLQAKLKQFMLKAKWTGITRQGTHPFRVIEWHYATAQRSGNEMVTVHLRLLDTGTVVYDFVPIGAAHGAETLLGLLQATGAEKLHQEAENLEQLMNILMNREGLAEFIIDRKGYLRVDRYLGAENE